MRVHFIVHESFEAPGAYETWAINQGHDVTYHAVHAGDLLPDDAVGTIFLSLWAVRKIPTPRLKSAHTLMPKEQALIASGG